MASLMSIIRGVKVFAVSSLLSPIATFTKDSVKMIKREMVMVVRSIVTVTTTLVIGKRTKRMDGVRRST